MKIVQSKILEVIFFRQFVPFCLHNFGAQNKGAQQRCQLQQDIEQREKRLSCVVIGVPYFVLHGATRFSKNL